VSMVRAPLVLFIFGEQTLAAHTRNQVKL